MQQANSGLTRVVLAAVASLAIVGCSTHRSGPAPKQVPSANEIVQESKLSQMPAFADVPWADALKTEQDRLDRMGKPMSRYGSPAVPDFSGAFTTVKDAERRTLTLPCDCPEREIWWFGGSAAFGLGQRDDHTIASDLVTLAQKDGIKLKVRNLAVPGSTSTEEANWLERHLEVDKRSPDLVVFYDGFNDVLSSYMNAIVNRGELLDPVSFEGDFVGKYIAMVPPPDIDPKFVGPVVDHVVTAHRARRSEVVAAMGKRNVGVESFFQGDAFVSPLQASGLAKSLNTAMADIADKSGLSQMLRQTADRLEPEVHNLRPALETFDKPVFADPGHMNETGAQVMAERIYAVIGPRLHGSR